MKNRADDDWGESKTECANHTLPTQPRLRSVSTLASVIRAARKWLVHLEGTVNERNSNDECSHI